MSPEILIYSKQDETEQVRYEMPIRRALQEFGYKEDPQFSYISSLETGVQLLEKAKDGDYIPNIVIIDFDMRDERGFTGFDLLKEFRKIESPFHAVPIIALTDDFHLQAEEKITKSGAIFALKPLETSILTAIIQEIHR